MPPPVVDPIGAAGLEPRRAPVTPRVRTMGSGASLPLEYHVRGLLGAGACGAINLAGPTGSGKTVALEHIAEVFRHEPRLCFFDRNSIQPPARPLSDALGIFTSRERVPWALANFEMSPWVDDDLIEYLANTHRGRVNAVMRRVTDAAQLHGLPELWRIALDVLAADESIPDIWAALRWYVGLEVPDEKTLQAIRIFSLAELVRPDIAGMPFTWLGEFEPRIQRLVRHRSVELPLAAELLFKDLCYENPRTDFARKLPHDLLRHTASLAKPSPRAVESLAAMVCNGSGQANAVSILHQIDIGWRPETGCVPNLAGAYLDGAQWADVFLPACNATRAHFERANLAGARLDKSVLSEALFAGACMAGTSMRQVSAYHADFTDADLSSAMADRSDFSLALLTRANLRSADLSNAALCCANLTEARLTEANLCGVDLQDALIAGADFEGANLASAKLSRHDLGSANFSGACFWAANLNHCNLEYIELPDANFRNANLDGALLTGSIMPRANFHHANLRDTGLADVEWEGADLRKADLTGASFHAGSTRSGLVGSVVAGEGSRTGFYTDDFNDRDYKPPEEIRKANLCRANLRGAKIDGVDFYLVDLRGARYSRRQAKWFRKCGAIL